MPGYNAFTHYCCRHDIAFDGGGRPEPHPRYETPPGRQLQFDWKEDLWRASLLPQVKGSVRGVPNSDEQTVAEKMRSFGAGSMRHRDVFDVYYHLRIKGIDVGVLGSCMAKDIFGDESMREEGWADVFACLEKGFSDRRCVRQLSRAKDNWLEFPVGKVTAGILSEVKKIMTR